MKQFRQGDVFIEQVRSLPDKVKAGKREHGKIVLAYGEVTGHAHTIADKEAKSFVDSDGVLYLELGEDTAVDHQEHDTITLPAGFYRVSHQREYRPEAIKRVRD